MGEIIQGKEYRTATCQKCGYVWVTCESTEKGLCSDDVGDLKKMGYKCKVGSDLCVGCYLEICEKAGEL